MRNLTALHSMETGWRAKKQTAIASPAPFQSTLASILLPHSTRHRFIQIGIERADLSADSTFSECTMPHKKMHLPEKICVACGRSFAWRRKWAAHWEQVRYCSERCRNGGTPTTQKTDSRTNTPSAKRPSQSS
ncbi:MAG: DUF2256 domain-containing protein [Pirellulaceae bacterium]